MGKNRSLQRQMFRDTANALFTEVISGQWNHVIPDWNSTPVEQWRTILAEFSSRCPGHTTDEYIEALRRCQWNNR